MRMAFVLVIAIICYCSFSQAEVIQREGQGFLELSGSQKVLHVRGTPYEMGFQHGALLKDLIQRNVKEFLETTAPGLSDRVSAFKQNLPKLLSYTPKRFHEEMQGLADGSGEFPLPKSSP